jgi:hypothetical protein
MHPDFALTTKQRRYLKQRGTKREKLYPYSEEDILRKLELLPRRIQELLIDVDCFYSEGYMNSPINGGNTAEFVGWRRTSLTPDGNSIEHSPDSDGDPLDTIGVLSAEKEMAEDIEKEVYFKAIQMGRALGKMTGKISRLSAGEEWEDIATDYAYGFVKGLQLNDDMNMDPREVLSTVTEMTETKLEILLESWDDRPTVSEYHEMQTSVEDRINKILREDYGSSIDHMATPPRETTELYEMDDDELKEVVDEEMNTELLVNMRNSIPEIAKDLQRLRDKSNVKGVNPVGVLFAIPIREHKTPAKIDTQREGEKGGRYQVATILKDFGNIDRDKKREEFAWENRLVEKNNGKWKITGYGYLLKCAYVNRSNLTEEKEAQVRELVPAEVDTDSIAGAMGAYREMHTYKDFGHKELVEELLDEIIE